MASSIKAIRCKQDVTVQESEDRFAKGVHVVGTKKGEISSEMAERIVANPRLAVAYDLKKQCDVDVAKPAEVPEKPPEK